MKKFFSLVLALVMALSLTTAAWGAEAINTQEALDAAVANGGEITLAAGEYAFPKITAKCTITCEEGVVFKGQSSPAIAGSTVIGATFSNPGGTAVRGTVNGIFKNCTFDGGNALRWCYAGETVEFYNCVFTGDTYGVHFDGGEYDAYFEGCTFSGFNAMGSALTMLTMKDCTFKTNGRSGYNGINLWGSTEMTDCTFIFDGSVNYEWCDLCGDNKTGTFTGCVVTDGTNTKNIATVVGDYGTGNSITIDSKATDGKYTGGYFNTDPTANVAEGYVVVKDGAFYKVQQAVVAPEGETATGETTNNVAESVQDAVKDAVASGSTETEVVVGETKIEFNDTTDMAKFADDTADITTQIVVEDVTDTVDADVVDAVEELVEEQVGEIGEDVVVAAYVEIDIHVFADGDHVGQITELPEKIRVSVPLPAGVTAEAGKKYYVAHEHDGVVELLPATIEGGYVVFYSDTFSTYAVVTQSVPSSAGVALTDKVDMVTTDASQTKYPNVTVNVHKANAPKDTNKDGRFDVSGNVKYFMMMGKWFVQVNTVSEADFTAYVAGTKTLFGYFKEANPFYYGYGVPFNNFGDKCGQYDDEPVAGTKYYTFETNLYKAVKAGAEDFNLMVGNELVPVELMSDEWVEHVAAYTYDKNYKVVGVKCAECGTPATLYANFASLPKAVQKGVQGVDYFAIGDGQYYYWQAASVAPETKVESAETFDAGIAMYVGMSVMAAAGSAVVIGKKKD